MDWTCSQDGTGAPAKAAPLLQGEDRPSKSGQTTTTVQGWGQEIYEMERQQEASLVVQSGNNNHSTADIEQSSGGLQIMMMWMY